MMEMILAFMRSDFEASPVNKMVFIGRLPKASQKVRQVLS
jgi:hypothetical protein